MCMDISHPSFFRSSYEGHGRTLDRDAIVNAMVAAVEAGCVLTVRDDADLTWTIGGPSGTVKSILWGPHCPSGDEYTHVEAAEALRGFRYVRTFAGPCGTSKVALAMSLVRCGWITDDGGILDAYIARRAA